MTEAPDPTHTILVIADPGQPTRRLESIRDRFEEALSSVSDVRVAVETRSQTLQLRPDAGLDVDSAERISREHDHVDSTVLLTEVPLYTHGRPLISETFPEHNVAVVSCPVLGAWATKRRILKTMISAALRLSPPADRSDPSAFEFRWSSWTRVSGTDGEQLHAHTFTGPPRMLLGMVMANEPFRTAPRLSSALAAASATGAFGIFYHSIWEMADALSTPRLLFIGMSAVLLMIGWLIFSNGLWDTPRRDTFASVVLLYNLSTVLTLLICVTALYLALVLLILTGGVVVIDFDFMRSVIGDQADWRNYLDIAWLSAAMGVVAGALGSSFDSQTELRRLTHGQRERQRHFTEEAVGEDIDDTPR